MSIELKQAAEKALVVLGSATSFMSRKARDQHESVVAELRTAIQQAEAQQAEGGEPYYGHQFREIRKGVWLCKCGKQITEGTTSCTNGTPNTSTQQQTADAVNATLTHADSCCAPRAQGWSIREGSSQSDTPPAIQQVETQQPATGEPVVSRNPFASRCYTMSESHLSGHRLIVGFEKLGDAQDAHEWVARQGRGDFTHPAPAVPDDVVRDAISTVREHYRGTDWGKAAESICDAIDAAMLAAK